MKKLSLKDLKLNTSNVLQRNQLKNVFGGGDLLALDGTASKCSNVCVTDVDCGAGNECFEGPCMGEPTWMCREKP